jgi:DNA-binding XRE family transcriptional regulator
MPTPSLSFRVQPHRHDLIRAVIERLKAADRADDPSVASALLALVEAVTPHVQGARLSDLERRIGTIETELNAVRQLVGRPTPPVVDPVLVEFGAEVRRRRQQQALSQRRLAAEVHLNERTVRMMEKGCGGNPNTRRRVADRLGLDTPEIPMRRT